MCDVKIEKINNIYELKHHLDLLNEVLNSDNECDANEDEL